MHCDLPLCDDAKTVFIYIIIILYLYIICIYNIVSLKTLYTFTAHTAIFLCQKLKYESQQEVA